jgi:hypothetical protein
MSRIRLTGVNSNGKTAVTHDNGEAEIMGSLIVGNNDSDNLTVNADVDSDLIPNVHQTYDLGTPAKAWNQVHANEFYGDGSNITGIVFPAVTVSGNDGDILFNSGGTIGTNSLFSIDSTTNHVSIGTGNTVATLQVHDAAAPNPMSDLGDPSLYQLGISGASTANNGLGIAFGDQNNVGAGIVFDDQGTQAAGSLRFYTKSSGTAGDAPNEVLTLKYDGNVGVGVNNPQNSLEVRGTVGVTKTSTDGGSFNFRTDGNSPTAGSVFGVVSFGSTAWPQAKITSEANTDWRLYSDPAGVSRETNLRFFITNENSASLREMLRLDKTGSYFYSDLDVSGDISATNATLSGDVSAATGGFSGDVVGGRLRSSDTIISTNDISSSAGSIYASSGSVNAVNLVATSDVSGVTGTFSGAVSASSFTGDGSGLTNIANGVNKQVQYNNNGELAGSVMYYDNTQGRLTIGTSASFGKLAVYDTTPYPSLDYGSHANYQINVMGTDDTTTRGAGISMGGISNVGVSLVQEIVGLNSQSDFVIRTKDSTTNAVDPVERLRVKHDGKVGVGVSDPYADMEVSGTLGLSSSTSGGQVEFRKNGSTATNAQDLGHISFGTDLATQASVFSSATENWVANSAHGTNITLSATPNGSTVESPVAMFANDASYIYSPTTIEDLGINHYLSVNKSASIGGDISITGDATAAYFIGDGSQLTNLPVTETLPDGTGGEVQFNNSGVFGASDMYYGSLSYSLGTTSKRGKFSVYKSTGTNGYQYSHLYNYTHISAIHPESEGNGGTSTVSLGTDTGITGQMMSVSNGINGKGALLFKVKNNTTSNGTLDNALSLEQSLTSYLPSIFNSTLRTFGAAEFNVSSSDPEENDLGFQAVVRGGSGFSAGLGFGVYGQSDVGSAVVATPISGKMQGLALKTQQTSGSALLSTLYVHGPTQYVAIGKGVATPSYMLDVNGETSATRAHVNAASPELRLTTTSTYPTAGTTIGSVYAKNQRAGLIFKALDNWNVGDNSTSVLIQGTSLNSLSTSTMALFSHNLTTLSSDLVSCSGDLRVVGDSELQGTLDVSGKITGTDATGIQATVGPVTAPKVVSPTYYASSTAWALDKEFLLSSYSTTYGYNYAYFRKNRAFVVYNSDDTQRPIYLKNSTANRKLGRLYLTSEGGAISNNSSLYSLIEKFGPEGVYIEGKSDSSSGSTSSSVTISNTRGLDYLNQSETNDANRHHQVGLDIIAGAMTWESTPYPLGGTDPVTTLNQAPDGDTKFIRFCVPFGGSTHQDAQDYWIDDADFKNPYKHTPLRVGRISGDGNGGVTYWQSFTGTHATVMKKDCGAEIGWIMSSTGEMWHAPAISTALPRVAPSGKIKDKTVFGIVSELQGGFDGYVASSKPREDEQHIEVNSIGEGKILVTNIGGNIENGDYITTSVIPGHGMLQDDDLLHNYTVAKCTEAIDWDSITDTVSHQGQDYKVYLISCTYHCG